MGTFRATILFTVVTLSTFSTSYGYLEFQSEDDSAGAHISTAIRRLPRSDPENEGKFYIDKISVWTNNPQNSTLKLFNDIYYNITFFNAFFCSNHVDTPRDDTTKLTTSVPKINPTTKETQIGARYKRESR